MCNSPLYRLVVDEWVVDRLPTKFKLRVKGGGVIINRNEYTYFRDVVCVPPDKLQTIPCGKCLGCKVDYQNVWSTRIQLEAKMHESNYFITLTYNEENIQKRLFLDVVTGKSFEYGVLVKKDFSDFIKRLRRLLDYRGLGSCRFLVCGEYGENGLRPHFHFIGCGLNLNDLVYFYSKGRKGAWRPDYEVGSDIFYRSSLIEKAWDKGFCLVSNVSAFNCSYVASYVNKKVSPSEISKNLTASNFYALTRDFGKPCAVKSLIDMGYMVSPFLHMSRNNGLAYTFFDVDEREYYWEFDRVKPQKNVKLYKKRFRYFDSLLEKLDKLWYAIFKRRRENKRKDKKFVRQWSNDDIVEMNRREEALLNNARHKKKREL